MVADNSFILHHLRCCNHVVLDFVDVMHRQDGNSAPCGSDTTLLSRAHMLTTRLLPVASSHLLLWEVKACIVQSVVNFERSTSVVIVGVSQEQIGHKFVHTR